MGFCPSVIVTDRHSVQHFLILFEPFSGLLIVGGTNKDQDSEGTLALLDRSLCYALSPLPEKRRAGLFAQVNETSLLYCGGRKSLLEINTECWTYSKDSWTVSEPLPRAIAGATSLGLGTKVWVFGGVVEEDYYDSYYIAKESEAEVLEPLMMSRQVFS